MIIKLSIILLLTAFIVLMAYWVVRTEEKQKEPKSFLEKDKSYHKAKEMGLKVPQEFNDILPGL